MNAADFTSNNMGNQPAISSFDIASSRPTAPGQYSPRYASNQPNELNDYEDEEDQDDFDSVFVSNSNRSPRASPAKEAPF